MLALLTAGVLLAGSQLQALRSRDPRSSENLPDQIGGVNAAGGIPTAAPASRSTPIPTPMSTAAARGGVLDEDFARNRLGWPDDPLGSAAFVNGGYHLFARQPDRFVAVRAPVSTTLRDVVVSARFRKIGGPGGGGYGLIVRDASFDVPDGRRQIGSYYVLEVGDRGEIGMWRRDGDHWVDLLPWTLSPAVRQGNAPNELTARTFGNQFTLVVNSVEVATREDSQIDVGGIGVFVGGDRNDVVLEHLRVDMLP